MIATPESGVDSIAVSWAMLDPVMTIIRPIAGLFTAVSTGITQNFFGTDEKTADSFTDMRGCQCVTVPDSPFPIQPPPLVRQFKDGMQYAFTDLLDDIAKPFCIGILIAGAITLFFPDDLSRWSNSHPFLSMLTMLVAGIPMYVCATSSTPIAAALILKGLNPGAALVFLLAGPATNAATINIVRTLFNARALLIYISMIILCSLTMGFILDYIYSVSGVNASVVVGQASEIISEPVQYLAAFILGLLLLINFIRKFKFLNSLYQRSFNGS